LPPSPVVGDESESFTTLGLTINADLALPSGSFAPYTNIPTYLVVVKKGSLARMFVAQLSSDAKTNLQIISNLKKREEGGTLELGRFVDPLSFIGLDSLRTAERFQAAERKFGAPALRLEDLATAITFSREGDGFKFEQHDHAIFVPLIGTSDVVDSLDELTLKSQNYAQVVIDPKRSASMPSNPLP
jgi:hypothetical protein